MDDRKRLAINEWLKRQKKPTSVLPKDNEKIARLVNLIRSGQIVLSTSWGSMHTDFMGNEELNRINYDFARWSRSYGISSEVAYMNDVPGHPMSVASVLADSGTKYLVTGANTFINNATDLAPGKVPFYWESLDGNKVLLWISQGNRGAYVEAFAVLSGSILARSLHRPQTFRYVQSRTRGEEIRYRDDGDRYY